MFDFCFLVFFLAVFYVAKRLDENKKQARKDAQFRATYRPSYTNYQSKSPDTTKPPLINGEYDGSFNKEFENK